MRPILFSKTSTTFTTNGLGRLDAISCKVIEERNGAYELEMEIAETADHASQIEADSIIVAKPSQADSLQPFRVYKLTKPINGKFTVLARHISYELNVITTMPFSVAQSAQACANTLAAAGFLLGVIIEWSLILFGAGLAIFLIIMLIGWIISWFK